MYFYQYLFIAVNWLYGFIYLTRGVTDKIARQQEFRGFQMKQKQYNNSNFDILFYNEIQKLNYLNIVQYKLYNVQIEFCVLNRTGQIDE